MSERMSIIGYPQGFKIRSLRDAVKACEIFRKSTGEHYFHDDENDYYTDGQRIYERSMDERGDIFSPYCEIANLSKAGAVDTVWKLRKAINHCIFADNER